MMNIYAAFLLALTILCFCMAFICLCYDLVTKKDHNSNKTHLYLLFAIGCLFLYLIIK